MLLSTSTIDRKYWDATWLGFILQLQCPWSLESLLYNPLPPHIFLTHLSFFPISAIPFLSQLNLRKRMTNACIGHRENENSYKTGCCYEGKNSASEWFNAVLTVHVHRCYSNTAFVYTYIMLEHLKCLFMLQSTYTFSTCQLKPHLFFLRQILHSPYVYKTIYK